jgi:hypothetical protein
VLGCALQLGERGDRGAGRAGLLVVDFEQHRFVGLHDQGAVGHSVHYPDSADTTDVTRWMANSRTLPDAGS